MPIVGRVGVSPGRMPSRGAGGSTAAHQQILTLADTDGWSGVYDPTNPDTRTLRVDGADNYSEAMSDGLGNLTDVIQASAASQPKLAVGRFGQLDGLDVSSGAQWLQNGTSAATITQPFMSIGILETPTPLDGAADFGFGGFDAASSPSGHLFKTAANVWAAGAGATLSSGVTADANPHIIAVIFNGASTRIYVDNLFRVQGNGGARELAFIAIGALFNGGLPWPGWCGPYAVSSGNNETKLLSMGSLWHELSEIPEAS